MAARRAAIGVPAVLGLSEELASQFQEALWVSSARATLPAWLRSDPSELLF